MSRPLVVVESPAKAKTIAKFLGPDFDVRASVGHIADLPSRGLAVDVDNGFVPDYELTPRGKDVVRELRAALKGATALYLATDEDREGEAISWHLLQHLKPPKSLPVRRMVFHEITKRAIDEAIANPRTIDDGLVDAAETRRILDRLFGYEVSPVLWRRVNRGLSAGRVQSPATRLVVERERERIAFVAAGYWDLEAAFATAPGFSATLVSLNGARVATGKDFGPDGKPRAEVVVLGQEAAEHLAEGLRPATFSVRSVEEKDYRSGPKPPFMTSTLQQEAGRKLRLGANQVMRLAQSLYERGYITYMRTDSVALSEQAVSAARSQVSTLYGGEYLSPGPRTYANRVKNAQEAHEAIRPAGDTFRTPQDVRGELNELEHRLYDLIWKRTLASQMADALGRTLTVRVGAVTVGAPGDDAEFSASGTTITFPGYRRVYVESVDEGEAADAEALLPALQVGQVIPLESLDAKGHATSPPPRYTEASLVKKLEELGIGRPSTWASIIQTIQDRGYVWKKGQALVPSWTAFAVVRLLEQHFDELVDYAFTARMEDDLDAIARNEVQKRTWLTTFYFGDEDARLKGLKQLVEENLDEIDAAEINSFTIGHDDAGEEIVVKPGRYGPYVKRGEETASVPDDLAPDELTVARAQELLAAPKGDEPLGVHDGLPVFVKTGRYGPYVQWGEQDAPPPGHDKPKMVSLFKTMTPERTSLAEAVELLSLPRTLGTDPADGLEVVAANGRYGPFVQKGKEYRSLGTEEELLTVSLEQALELLAQPKSFKRGRGAPKPPLRELGTDPISGRPVVAKEGRFGVYVTDGETNASLGKGDRLEVMPPERAYELLAARREAVAEGGTVAKKAPGARKATGARKASGAAKTTAKKAGGTATKATGAKKAAPRKKA
jgi:DNA topoisomerase I